MIQILKQAFSFALTLFIPLLYLETLAVISFSAHTLSLPLEIIITGALLAIGGLMLWGMSYVSLGSSFGVLPQKQKRVTKGVYKHLGHPMYIGIVLTFLGLSISLESRQGIFFLFIVIVPILLVRAYFEEKQLLKR